MTDKDAIDNYLVWELCKEQGIQKMIIQGSAYGEDLKEFVEKVKQKYNKKNYDRSEKMGKLQELDSNPEYRRRIFESCSWSRENVKLEDLGTTLPRFGSLPPEVVSGSLSEVVQFVRKADPEEYQSVKYIMMLKEVPEVLNEFLPWVITPGKRESKRDRMNKVHSENDWDIEDTWGMINDGNHRAIAKVLANDSDQIECYVGHRQSN